MESSGGFVHNTRILMQLKDGYWEVNVMAQDGRQLEDGTWDTREIAVKSIDTTPDRAYTTALNAVTRRYGELGRDLFQLSKEECDPIIKDPANSN